MHNRNSCPLQDKFCQGTLTKLTPLTTRDIQYLLSDQKDVSILASPSREEINNLISSMQSTPRHIFFTVTLEPKSEVKNLEESLPWIYVKITKSNDSVEITYQDFTMAPINIKDQIDNLFPKNASYNVNKHQFLTVQTSDLGYLALYYFFAEIQQKKIGTHITMLDIRHKIYKELLQPLFQSGKESKERLYDNLVHLTLYLSFLNSTQDLPQGIITPENIFTRIGIDNKDIATYKKIAAQWQEDEHTLSLENFESSELNKDFWKVFVLFINFNSKIWQVIIKLPKVTLVLNEIKDVFSELGYLTYCQFKGGTNIQELNNFIKGIIARNSILKELNQPINLTLSLNQQYFDLLYKEVETNNSILSIWPLEQKPIENIKYHLEKGESYFFEYLLDYISNTAYFKRIEHILHIGFTTKNILSQLNLFKEHINHKKSLPCKEIIINFEEKSTWNTFSTDVLQIITMLKDYPHVKRMICENLSDINYVELKEHAKTNSIELVLEVKAQDGNENYLKTIAENRRSKNYQTLIEGEIVPLERKEANFVIKIPRTKTELREENIFAMEFNHQVNHDIAVNINMQQEMQQQVHTEIMSNLNNFTTFDSIYGLIDCKGFKLLCIEEKLSTTQIEILSGNLFVRQDQLKNGIYFLTKHAAEIILKNYPHFMGGVNIDNLPEGFYLARHQLYDGRFYFKLGFDLKNTQINPLTIQLHALHPPLPIISKEEEKEERNDNNIKTAESFIDALKVPFENSLNIKKFITENFATTLSNNLLYFKSFHLIIYHYSFKGLDLFLEKLLNLQRYNQGFYETFINFIFQKVIVTNLLTHENLAILDKIACFDEVENSWWLQIVKLELENKKERFDLTKLYNGFAFFKKELGFALPNTCCLSNTDYCPLVSLDRLLFILKVVPKEKRLEQLRYLDKLDFGPTGAWYAARYDGFHFFHEEMKLSLKAEQVYDADFSFALPYLSYAEVKFHQALRNFEQHKVYFLRKLATAPNKLICEFFYYLELIIELQALQKFIEGNNSKEHRGSFTRFLSLLPRLVINGNDPKVIKLYFDNLIKSIKDLEITMRESDIFSLFYSLLQHTLIEPTLQDFTLFLTIFAAAVKEEKLNSLYIYSTKGDLLIRYYEKYIYLYIEIEKLHMADVWSLWQNNKNKLFTASSFLFLCQHFIEPYPEVSEHCQKRITNWIYIFANTAVEHSEQILGEMKELPYINEINQIKHTKIDNILFNLKSFSNYLLTFENANYDEALTILMQTSKNHSLYLTTIINLMKELPKEKLKYVDLYAIIEKKLSINQPLLNPADLPKDIILNELKSNNNLFSLRFDFQINEVIQGWQVDENVKKLLHNKITGLIDTKSPYIKTHASLDILKECIITIKNLSIQWQNFTWLQYIHISHFTVDDVTHFNNILKECQALKRAPIPLIKAIFAGNSNNNPEFLKAIVRLMQKKEPSLLPVRSLLIKIIKQAAKPSVVLENYLIINNACSKVAYMSNTLLAIYRQSLLANSNAEEKELNTNRLENYLSFIDSMQGNEKNSTFMQQFLACFANNALAFDLFLDKIKEIDKADIFNILKIYYLSYLRTLDESELREINRCQILDLICQHKDFLIKNYPTEVPYFSSSFIQQLLKADNKQALLNTFAKDPIGKRTNNELMSYEDEIISAKKHIKEIKDTGRQFRTETEYALYQEEQDNLLKYITYINYVGFNGKSPINENTNNDEKIVSYDSSYDEKKEIKVENKLIAFSALNAQTNEGLKDLAKRFLDNFKDSRSKEQTVPLIQKLEYIAILRQAAYRTLGLWADDVQLSCIINSFLLQTAPTISVLKTSAGKTLIMALHACLIAAFKECVYVGSREGLEERDYYLSRDLFDFLGFSSSIITEKTSVDQFDKGIYYTHLAALSLYVQAVKTIGRELEFKELTKGVLLDEVDHSLLSEQTQYRRTQQLESTRPLESEDTWLYHQMVAFYKESNKVYTYAEDFIKEFLEKISNDLPKRYYEEENFAARIIPWVQSLLTAMKLKKGDDYIISQSTLFIEGEEIDISKTVPKINDLKQPRAVLSNGVHQCLQARLQQQDEYKEDYFLIEPVVPCVSSFAVYSTITSLLGENDILNGYTATSGDRQEREELHKRYGVKFFNYPSFEKDQKIVEAPVLAIGIEFIIAIKNRVIKAREASQPVLIICDNVDLAEEIYLKIKQKDNKEEKEEKEEKEKNRIILYTDNVKHQHTAVSLTKNMGKNWDILIGTQGELARGANFVYKGEQKNWPGLVVLLACAKIPSERMWQQVAGRTARRGQPGIAGLYVKTDQELKGDVAKVIVDAQEAETKVLAALRYQNVVLDKIKAAYISHFYSLLAPLDEFEKTRILKIWVVFFNALDIAWKQTLGEYPNNMQVAIDEFLSNIKRNWKLSFNSVLSFKPQELALTTDAILTEHNVEVCPVTIDLTFNNASETLSQEALLCESLISLGTPNVTAKDDAFAAEFKMITAELESNLVFSEFLTDLLQKQYICYSHNIFSQQLHEVISQLFNLVLNYGSEDNKKETVKILQEHIVTIAKDEPNAVYLLNQQTLLQLLKKYYSISDEEKNAQDNNFTELKKSIVSKLQDYLNPFFSRWRSNDRISQAEKLLKAINDLQSCNNEQQDLVKLLDLLNDASSNILDTDVAIDQSRSILTKRNVVGSRLQDIIDLSRKKVLLALDKDLPHEEKNDKVEDKDKLKNNLFFDYIVKNIHVLIAKNILPENFKNNNNAQPVINNLFYLEKVSEELAKLKQQKILAKSENKQAELILIDNVLDRIELYRQFILSNKAFSNVYYVQSQFKKLINSVQLLKDDPNNHPIALSGYADAPLGITDYNNFNHLYNKNYLLKILREVTFHLLTILQCKLNDLSIQPTYENATLTIIIKYLDKSYELKLKNLEGNNPIEYELSPSFFDLSLRITTLKVTPLQFFSRTPLNKGIKSYAFGGSVFFTGGFGTAGVAIATIIAASKITQLAIIGSVSALLASLPLTGIIAIAAAGVALMALGIYLLVKASKNNTYCKRNIPNSALKLRKFADHLPITLEQHTNVTKALSVR